MRQDSTGGGSNSVPFPASTSRASAVGSDTPGLNGRSISLAQWNRHYLLPTIANTDSTPVAAFTAPDWVFVTAEKGPDVLTGPQKDAAGGTVTVTGRYAHAIYDEGGLLDANHTGYPSVSTTTPIGLGHIGAKPGPSYADLTQLPARGTGGQSLTPTNVDGLLGWRNYASLQPTDAFPFLKPSTSLADSAYYNLFASTTENMMQVSLTTWNNKTDQTFLTRQQLIDYFNATTNSTDPNSTDPNSNSKLDLWYLQFLGTFSRSLNQPSYAPETNRPDLSSKTWTGLWLFSLRVSFCCT